ncbi:MAG: hypothetical protein OEM49_03455 [Myxococcales bacterium]|nr:hypothetical protein [Myxococcales bacterium]MDH5307093.1 hypothetical protein [Myxococcales bacterium]MDH5565062.1 hypothetical protein [Myxococcales bacterium]
MRDSISKRVNASDAAESPGVDAVRVFLGAALAVVDAREFERAPARKLSTWLFSLGASDALARRLGLAGRAATSLGVDVFRAFYALDPVSAATVVGRLNHLATDARWCPAREAGRAAMDDWLTGVRQDAHERLRDLIAAPAAAEAAHFAAGLTGIEGDAAPRAPRQRDVPLGRRAVASLAAPR